ncbi:MAG TPA: LptF/LptG family permease [Bryobacteraceae bacterium]|nr:LptF/LptG family permease [Bryobacteraceae bacterium]
MRTLGRYVFREILSSALIGTLLATCVIFLQKVGPLVGLLVRSSASADLVLWLFALGMPALLPLTIPFGVLVGILIGLGRMSSDGEIIAMRAAGVPGRRLTIAVMVFATLATVVAGTASLKLAPLAQRESTRLIKTLLSTQLTAEIQPRVFEEQFPRTILYVGDVRQAGGSVAVWRNIFMADLTPPEERSTGLREGGAGPLVTVAREALAVPDPEHNRIQLSLRNASIHEMGKDAVASDAFWPRGEQALEAAPPSEVRTKPILEMTTTELRRHSKEGMPNYIEARIEWNRRLALPLACIMLALVGIPLGISSRKGGKSAGYVWGVFLSFFCYYGSFGGLIGLAKQRAVPVEVAVWTPNVAFALAGLILLARMERAGGRHDPLGTIVAWIGELGQAVKQRMGRHRSGNGRGAKIRLVVLPQIVDTYVLSGFLFYFVVIVASFVSLTEIFTFLELLGDMVRNNIPLSKMFTYLVFLLPRLIYETVPISVLVAVLVTFGVLSKQNEVIAFKACGVSLYRLALPILIMSGLLSAGLFAFDHYYVPDANRRQDALRNEIKGRAPQSYLSPDRKWIKGKGSRIYYYKYFDTAQEVMAGVSVYELNPETFALVRQISAERARWQPSLGTWVFENGWYSNFNGSRRESYQGFPVQTFPELNEDPRYFRKEVLQDEQMNFRQLDEYIADLQQSGFDTVKLRVQFYRKFSVPLFALIMAMIAIPFGFLVGNRGAMAGVGVSIGIALAYWAVGVLFEQIGNANQLPPAVAAWAPNGVFSLTGLYLLLRMKS